MSIGGLWGLQGTQLVMGQGWRTHCHKQTERVIRVWVWVRSPDPGGVPEKQRIGWEASCRDARVTKVDRTGPASETRRTQDKRSQQ